MASYRPQAAPTVPSSGVSKLLAQANRSAAFDGRFGNPWVAGAGMSPVAERAYLADQARLQEGIRPSTPGVTITIQREAPPLREELMLRDLMQQYKSPTLQRSGQSVFDDEMMKILGGAAKTALSPLAGLFF